MVARLCYCLFIEVEDRIQTSYCLNSKFILGYFSNSYKTDFFLNVKSLNLPLNILGYQ